MAWEIPILNLYYLLSYAWDHFQAGEQADLAHEDCPDAANLFALLLNGGLRQLFRRGMERSYITEREETPRLRGRIDLSASVRRLGPQRGRLVCEYDELSRNILPNRILRTCVDRLLAEELTPENHRALRLCREKLAGVSPILLTAAVFRRVQFHRNNRLYRFLLNLCALIHRCLLPSEQRGHGRLQSLLHDEMRLHGLFEKFVRAFAMRHCAGARVGAPHIAWQAEYHTAEAESVLPGMHTDLTVEWPARRIILDCKFYGDAFTSNHGGARLHSGNLYQLMAYLKNQAVLPGWESVEGILLYPAVSHAFDHRYTLLGHRVRIVSVDLDQPWRDIHAMLHDLLTETVEAVAGIL
jgi:5-methylcytosine-specific restriction enzyme subunit McrC